MQIHPSQGIVRTSALAGRTADHLIGTKVALGGFHYRSMGLLIKDEGALFIANFNHLNIVIGTTVRTGGAANACGVIDNHLSFKGISVNSSGGASDHADRVSAVHTGVGNHVTAELPSLSDKARVIVVCRGAGTDTVIAPGAAIKVYNHRCRSVDETVFDQQFHDKISGLAFGLLFKR